MLCFHLYLIRVILGLIQGLTGIQIISVLHMHDVVCNHMIQMFQKSTISYTVVCSHMHDSHVMWPYTWITVIHLATFDNML